MERGLILNIACLIVAVCKARQGESANVETGEGEYVPGSDGYAR
jgi:hypothetical protein